MGLAMTNVAMMFLIYFRVLDPGFQGLGSRVLNCVPTFGPWTLDSVLCFHPLLAVVQQLVNDLLALPAGKTTQTGFPDVITAHIHAVIAAVEQLAAFSFTANGAHECVF